MCKLKRPDDVVSIEAGNSYQSRNAKGVIMTRSRRWKGNSRMYKTLLVTLAASAFSIGAVAAVPAVRKEPLDAATLSAIKSRFGRLMELASRLRVRWCGPHTPAPPRLG